MARLSTAVSFQVGEWLVEPSINQIRRADDTVTLEPRVMALLVYLAERAGEVVSAEDLQRELWPGRVVGDDSIYQSIAKLRKALGDSSSEASYLATIPKRGYRLTARMQSAAEPEVMFDASMPLEPTSARPRSPIVKAVLLPTLLAAVALAAFLYFRHSSIAPSRTLESIAVLPFENLSPDTDSQHFAEGVSEEILNALARVPKLRVVARTSSFAFRGAKRDVRDIARTLTADAVLEGSVQKSADRVRISVRLIDAKNGLQLWGDRFDRDLGDIFDVQEEIAKQVLAALPLRTEDVPLTSHARTDDITAYDYYLLGRHYGYTRSRESLYKSVDMFRRALARDDDYAVAHAGLGSAYLLLSFYGDLSFAEAIEHARPAIEEAMQLNPTDPEVWGAEGLMKYLQFDYQGAAANYERALELSPTYVQAHIGLGSTMMKRGLLRDAIKHYEQALYFDPLSSLAVVNYSRSLSFAGRHEEAVERLQRTIAAIGAAPHLYRTLARLHVDSGRFADGFRWAKKALEMDAKGAPSQAMLGYAYALLGEFQLGAEWLEKAVRTAPDSSRVMELQALRFLESGEFEAFDKYTQGLVQNPKDHPNSPINSSVRWRTALAGTAKTMLGEFESAQRQLNEALTGEHIFRGDADAYICTNWAYAFAQLGDAASIKFAKAKCHETITRARENGWETGWLAYGEARLHALSGDRVQALQALRPISEQHGIHHGMIVHDPLFAGFRGEVDFEAIVSQLKAVRDEAVAELRQGGSL